MAFLEEGLVLFLEVGVDLDLDPRDLGLKGQQGLVTDLHRHLEGGYREGDQGLRQIVVSFASGEKSDKFITTC